MFFCQRFSRTALFLRTARSRLLATRCGTRAGGGHVRIVGALLPHVRLRVLRVLAAPPPAPPPFHLLSVPPVRHGSLSLPPFGHGSRLSSRRMVTGSVSAVRIAFCAVSRRTRESTCGATTSPCTCQIGGAPALSVVRETGESSVSTVTEGELRANARCGPDLRSRARYLPPPALDRSTGTLCSTQAAHCGDLNWHVAQR